jgi:aryl sulfotransferase
MQQIVTQLILNGDESINVHVSSPWLDVRGLAPELRDGLEAQSHRRCIKTHLPVDALVFSPKAKYIYIGRDGRDAALSFFNHHYNANEEYFARFNCGANPAWPPFERGTSDPAAFFRRWL